MLLNFYWRFVPHAAEMFQPLYELVNLTAGALASAWTTSHLEYFQRSKDALAAAIFPPPTARQAYDGKEVSRFHRATKVHVVHISNVFDIRFQSCF